MCFEDALSGICQPTVSIKIDLNLDQPDPYAQHRPDMNHQYIRPEDDPLCQEDPQGDAMSDLIKQIQDMMSKSGMCGPQKASQSPTEVSEDKPEDDDKQEPPFKKKED